MKIIYKYIQIYIPPLERHRVGDSFPRIAKLSSLNRVQRCDIIHFRVIIARLKLSNRAPSLRFVVFFTRNKSPPRRSTFDNDTRKTVSFFFFIDNDTSSLITMIPATLRDHMRFNIHTLARLFTRPR